MKTIINIISILILFGCNVKSQSNKDHIGADFDLLNNIIYFTHFENGIGAIYSYNIESTQLKRISLPTRGYDFRPRVSNDKKKIIFISNPFPGKEHPHLILINNLTNSIDTLLKNQPFLTEAIFSFDENEVFFLCASEYKNYSPIVRPARHGYDLFAVDITTKRVRQITNKKEYVMHNLILAEGGEYAFCAMPPMDGVVKINLSNGKKIPFELKGNPRPEVSGHFKAISIRNDSVLYEAPYELYFHNNELKKSEFILRTPDHSHFQIIRPDDNWKNLFFTTSSHGFYVYNTNTLELRNLENEINKKLYTTIPIAH